VVTIGLKGSIWTPINVKPRYVRLRGTEDEEIEAVVRLERKKKEPLTAKVTSVTIPDKVEVDLRETNKGRTYELKVKNKAKGGDRYRGELRLATNYPEKPEIVIRITGDIRRPLEVKPKKLNFGRISQQRLEQLKANPKAMNRWATVRLNKGNNLRIKKMELQKSLFRVSAQQTKPGRVIRIQIEPVLEKLKKGTNQDRLKIYTNQKGQEILEMTISLDLL
jgi:hypothetical protein